MKALLLAVLIAASPLAHAQLPTGASIVAGSISIAQASNAMTITQASHAAIVNWQSFDIGAGSRVNLIQPNSTAAMLARVTGGSPTSLQGALQANGRLFLINQNGVVIGKNAIINTAGFVASTLDVANASFLAGGPLTFSGDSGAGVVNLGTITASEGNVYLFAHTVANGGSITAPKGTVGLAAGTQVELASPGAPGFTVSLNLPTTPATTGVDNSGVITAVQAQLEAAGGSIYELAVNQSGVVRATGSADVNGRVLLTADGGTVGVSGTVNAQNADGSGGEILVGGDYQGSNASIANASHTVVTPTGSLNASAVNSTGAAGRVIVWSDEGTRFLGSLTATGATGGFAEVSGRQYLDFNPATPVQLGANGNLLLDPDALVISTGVDSDTSTTSGNPYVFGVTTTPANLNVTTLENQLASSNVTLDTSASGGDITVNAPISWSTNNTLRLQAGGSINLNTSITGGASSTLALYAGLDTNSVIPAEEGGVSLNPGATLDSSATITVGTLIYGANSAANVSGQTVITPASTGPLELDGNISVKTLEIDLSGGAAAVSTNGSNNSIGAFTTVGTGVLNDSYVENNQGAMSVTLNSSAAQGPYLQFITPGNLTLTSGSSLNFDPSSTGTVLLASTGGAFINQAGSAVFGSNASFQIYSSSPAATTLGGLAGTDVYAHPYNSSDSYTGNYVFYVSSATGSPVLNYTADDLSRTYGAANPALTYTTTGWQSGVTDDVTGSPSLSVGATQSSGVGSYTISIGSGTLASSNYDFVFDSGTLSITKASLTISVKDASKVYGSTNPAFSYTATGFLNTDTSAVLSGAPTLSTTATTASGVGGYAITGATGTLSASNYDFTFTPGTLSITKADLTITPNAANKVYGSANPTFSYTATGFLNTDTSAVLSGAPSLSTSATAASGVGSYAITAAAGTLSASNYDFTFAPGTLNITPADLTITVNDASKVYGSANPAFSYTVAGFVNGDTSAVLSGAPTLSTTATPASGVGGYAITGATGTLSAGNYDFTFTPGTLSITPAELTITANASKVYGSANPVFSYTASGFVNGDTSAVLSGTPSLSTSATAASGVGSYAITAAAGTLSASNYDFTFAPGTLNITPADLTITVKDASKVYGSANPAFSYTVAGFVNGDTSAVLSGAPSLSTTATTASGVGGYAITGATGTLSAGNYDFTFTPGTLNITKAPLTVTILSANGVYGQPNPAFDAVFAGFQNGDTSDVISGYALSTTATASSSPGDYLITGSGTAANYQITFNPAFLLIQRSVITISIPNETAVVQGVPSSFPVQYTPPVSGGPGFTITGVSTGTNASAPGIYPITAQIAGTDGVSLDTLEDYYEFGTKQPATLTIKSPAVVTNSVSLQPGTLLQNLPTGNTLINTNDTTTNSTVTVNKPQSVNVTINQGNLTASVPPLTAKQYANFMGEFDGNFSDVEKNLSPGYTSFLKGAGVSGSAYEKMPSAARTLLAGFMSGSVSMQYLQSLVATGNPTALQVLAYVLPGLVQLTLAKPTSELTFNDNTLLSRLGDLTAQHMDAVVTYAQYDYQQMNKANAANAQSSGLEVLFAGGGDFSNILQQANQQAVAEYLGAALGAAGGTIAAAGIAIAIPAVVAAVFPNTGILTAAGSAAGPAIAAVNMAVLAVRAVQISQSEQNQKAYAALMASWPPGSTINSISQLKSAGMSQNVQVGTLMLSTDVLSLSSGS